MGAGLGEILLDVTPEPRAPSDEVLQGIGNRGPHPVRALADAWVNVAVRTPMRVAGIVSQTARQQLAVRSLKNKPPRFFSGPATRFNATLSPHRRVTGVRIELASWFRGYAGSTSAVPAASSAPPTPTSSDCDPRAQLTTKSAE